MSDSIALCITGSGDCKIKYQNIANSFNITKEEIDQNDIASIESKIESEAEKESSKFSELISKMDQSLREQNEKSTIQILNSSADEALKSFCGQYNSTARESSSPEPQALSAPSEGPTTESVETTTNQELFPT
ncbi:MAG: WBM0748 family T4SS-associated protein [Wolbachia sp.]